jgi:hypothetical protein
LLALFAGSILGPVSEFPPLDEWPIWTRAIAAEHGVSATWQASLESLGYPPTWVRGAAEAKPVEDFLLKLKAQDNGN